MSAKRSADVKPLFSVTTKDLEVQTFSSGGPGGQNVNRRSTGARIIHAASGARGESREERSQLQNKRTALKRLTQTPAFKFWVRQKVKEIDGHESIEQWVDRQMADIESIKVEVKDPQGRWVDAISALDSHDGDELPPNNTRSKK